MKSLFIISRSTFLALILFVLVIPTGLAQNSAGFSYQAIARNQEGVPLADKELVVRIAIRETNQEGNIIWQEEHQVQTNKLGLFNLTVGDPAASNQSGIVDAFDQIDWSASAYFLHIWVNANGTFTDLGGSAIQTVPMASYAHTASSAMGNFSIQPGADAPDGEALFEVRRKDGQPVFAVYEDMVWVYVDTISAKGVRGGFAVGGYSRKTKGVTEEYLHVGPDSVRVYVNDDPAKGVRGGFAVGGYSRKTKGISQDFLRISPDSVRVYIDSDPQAKGVRGGFAVGGYSRTKASLADDLYLNVSGKSAVDVVEDQSQIMWYPRKEAFLAGNIHVGSVDSVGQNSTAMGYKSVAMGNFSQAFGFRSMSLGNYSTSFGKGSVAEGEDSYAIGSSSRATHYRSIALGVDAEASGSSAMALGSSAKALNSYATAIGYRSEASGLYANSFGLHARAQGERSMALGMSALASGYRSISMGYGSLANEDYAMAIGVNALATADTTISIGSGAEASGPLAVALGAGTLGSGKLSTAIGYNAVASGYKSISMGAQYTRTFVWIPIIIIPPIFTKGGDPAFTEPKPETPSKDGSFVLLPLFADRNNEANGTYSMALGNGNLSENGGTTVGVFNDALSDYSTAIGFGNQAAAPYSFAGGFANRTDGQYATAFGRFTSAASLNSFAIGTYNRSVGTDDDWIATDPLFQIGNGTGPDPADQHDAFRVNKNGSTYIYPQNNYYGLYVYGNNNFYNGYYYNRIDDSNTRTSVYGLYSRVYSTDSNLGSAYSGYFSGSLSTGTYNGLYADLRTGDAIDVAEYIYDSKGDTEAGDVLVADPEKEESVLKSSEPYQASVLGVVSTKPHMVMGMDLVVDSETGESIPGVSATRLALTGRVPVKVSEENGSISPGDLLTTSSTPGRAMKWSLLDVNKARDFEELKQMLAENERRRNAIIGKALSASGDSDTVVVLISLQ